MPALLRFGPLSLAGALALGIVAAAVAAPGDLDPTFGNGGSVVVSPYVENAGVAAALQPDGKICWRAGRTISNRHRHRRPGRSGSGFRTQTSWRRA
jgi:hypothetical protein